MSLLCACRGNAADSADRLPLPGGPDDGSSLSLSYLRSPPMRRKFPPDRSSSGVALAPGEAPFPARPPAPGVEASSSVLTVASSRSGGSFWFGRSSESSLYPGAKEGRRGASAWRRRSHRLSWCKRAQSECAAVALAHDDAGSTRGSTSHGALWMTTRSTVSLGPAPDLGLRGEQRPPPTSDADLAARGSAPTLTTEKHQTSTPSSANGPDAFTAHVAPQGARRLARKLRQGLRGLAALWPPNLRHLILWRPRRGRGGSGVGVASKEHRGKDRLQQQEERSCHPVPPAELAHSVQDAFVIAVEQQARERLEKLSQLKRIKPVDMNKLSKLSKLSEQRPGSPSRPGPSRESSQSKESWNGIIDHNSVFVTSLGPAGQAGEGPSTSGAPGASTSGLQRQASIASCSSEHSAKPRPSLTNGHGQAGGSASAAGGGGGSGQASQGASFDEADVPEVELKQDLDVHQRPPQGPQGPPRSLQDRRASSPFANGRTELLIPGLAGLAGNTDGLLGAQDGHAHRMRTTTALVEHAKQEPTEEEWSVRPRRSLVGGSKAAEANLDLRMLAGDSMPLSHDYRASDALPALPALPLHREMAVDVPDSFIARSKTPPRYPPPRPVGTGTGVNGSVVKPVPPPRGHLRIEEDGRLVNRAPAPQLPARPPDNNNDPDKEPTKEQLTSIRKYQEQMRQRKAEEERQAAQAEFLNRSLRGSRKLQALQEPILQGLEKPRAGVVNDGYSSTEDADLEPELPVDDPTSVVHRVISYGELVAAIQRLQLQLKKTGNSTISGPYPGYSALEGQVAAVQTLLLSPAFGRALAVHNKVQQVSAQLHSQPDSRPVSSHAQGLLRDCLDVIQPCALPEATELAELLTRYDIEGLLLAHDALASHEIAMVSPTLSEVPPDEPPPPLLPPLPPSQTPLHTAPVAPARAATSFSEEHIKIIKIEKTHEPLGATVRNEGDAVMIGRVVRGGAAEKTGLLHQGDEVLEVNGVAMRGKSVNEVCDILAAMNGTLTFFVVPASRNLIPLPPPPREALMHVRAFFDYDPEDDLFIPCRELGVSFQKGDVLHVISQEDPNWWQAYREGEEDQTLAGLIPSKSFQHQREAYKQASIATTDPKEKTKKASTLLCAKKNAKKKKKKGYGTSYVDGNYPLYSSSTTEEYDTEEILTYEEVALYYPRANHKRPVVLIGPPNIGRHELRQRLMEDSERFAAAIPHTSRARKENEVDGQDYHFISRQQFESDILARKFVEHGEYERAYYGTSLDAIRSVVAAGKICVLNLHPQSLRILRNSDLKPYVVLVAPPALEKLRQKKLRNGEAFKEEELKETIEKAREMEDKYGHMLDLVIINSDTERAFSQLLSEINSLEREPQWVPTAWVRQQ